jgi:hypothetical protein
MIGWLARIRTSRNLFTDGIPGDTGFDSLLTADDYGWAGSNGIDLGGNGLGGDGLGGLGGGDMGGGDPGGGGE